MFKLVKALKIGRCALLNLLPLLLCCMYFHFPAAVQAAGAETAASANSKTKTESCPSKEDLQYSYRRTWELVRDNTMFPERLLNWEEWEHRFDGKIKSTEDLEEAVNLMLSRLNDRYTYFRNEEDTRAWRVQEDDLSVVTAYKLPRNIAYIAIRSFSSLHTTEELESALTQLQDACGYIIDLRDNRGGYVEQALSCFELLVDEGRFTSISGREEGKPYNEILTVQNTYLLRYVNGKISMELRRKNLSGKKPMLILVNNDTRSAAEMLAGALKDTKRANIVGSRTYGKGVVQSSWSLKPGCSIKIAMARYFLPSGRDINGIGIIPDYPLAPYSGLPEDGSRRFSKSNIECSRLKNSLPAIPWSSLEATSAGLRLIVGAR